MYERSVLLLPSRRDESNWQRELAQGKEFPPNDFPKWASGRSRCSLVPTDPLQKVSKYTGSRPL